MAVIFCETSNPTKWVIDQPPTVRITGRHRPDRGTIGGSRADRDYRMSTYDNAHVHHETVDLASTGGSNGRGLAAAIVLSSHSSAAMRWQSWSWSSFINTLAALSASSANMARSSWLRS